GVISRRRQNHGDFPTLGESDVTDSRAICTCSSSRVRHSLQISLRDLRRNNVCQFLTSTHWRGKPLSPGKGLTPVVSHVLDGGPGRSVADTASCSDPGISGTDAESL